MMATYEFEYRRDVTNVWTTNTLQEKEKVEGMI